MAVTITHNAYVRGLGCIAGLVCTVLLASCSQRSELAPLSPADSLRIVEDNLSHRSAAEEFFRDDPNSPFHRDTTVTFEGIRWFPVNPHYRVRSVLHRYENPETVIVLGTRGEERRQLRYGYFAFILPGDNGQPVHLRLNAYKFTPYDQKRYALYKDNLSVWFTDRTTGKETYEVGRYLEIGDEHRDRDHAYTLDFNKAYNPYCAYTPLYSCAIPREEDTLPIAVRAGELKYHHE